MIADIRKLYFAIYEPSEQQISHYDNALLVSPVAGPQNYARPQVELLVVSLHLSLVAKKILL